jgi:hypothetical protein
MHQAGAGGCDPMPPLRIPFPSPPAQPPLGSAIARWEQRRARRWRCGARPRHRCGADPSWSGADDWGATRGLSGPHRAGCPRGHTSRGPGIVPGRGRRQRRVTASDGSYPCPTAGRAERPPVCPDLGQRPRRTHAVGSRRGHAQPGRRGDGGLTGPRMVSSARRRAVGRLRPSLDARPHPARMSRPASLWCPRGGRSALRLDSVVCRQ